MLVLGLNMAVQPYSFAVVEGCRTVISQIFYSSYDQSESMISLIDDAMNRKGCTLALLQGVGVVVGPGQYTGVRMGVTLAKSLAMGLSIPVVGMTVFEALLQPYLRHSGLYLACIPARKDEYNVQLFGVKEGNLFSLTAYFSLRSCELTLFLSQFKMPIYVVSVTDISGVDTVYNIVTDVDARYISRYALESIFIQKKDDDVRPIYSHYPNAGKSNQKIRGCL